MDLLAQAVWIIFAVVLIGKGSDWLTDSLVPVAKRLGVSGAAVGLVLVSVVVSLPEILVAVYTAYKGYPIITFGVILGSIFVNIGLMTGFAALFHPLHVTRNLILRDGIFSIVVPILVFAVGAGGQITRLEGLAFVLLFAPYVINVFLLEGLRTTEERGAELKQVEIELGLLGFDFGKIRPGVLSFVVGAGLLLVGAQLFSNQLISVAENFKISQLIIGLTLGAIGPSIPNIAAAYKAAKQGMGEIAVSETLGSNIFTLLVTLGITAILVPLELHQRWLKFDLPALIFLSSLLFAFLIIGRKISRIEGLILLLCYLGILAIQIGAGV